MEHYDLYPNLTVLRARSGDTPPPWCNGAEKREYHSCETSKTYNSDGHGQPTKSPGGHEGPGSEPGASSSKEGAGSEPSASSSTVIDSDDGTGSTITPATSDTGAETSWITTVVSSFPTTVSDDYTTFTTFTETTFTTTAIPSSLFSGSESMSTPSPTSITQNGGIQAVCLGSGMDMQAKGVVATLVLPTALGLLVWLLFAILRPRFRQVYALREWFIPPDARPRPLSSSFFSFLFPPVPLKPAFPSDSDASNDDPTTPGRGADTFPSDEQLSQRVLWVAFTVALGWTILAAGLMPLYLVNTTCLADGSTSSSSRSGSYSTLENLSILRLLNFLESDPEVTFSSGANSGLLVTRDLIGGPPESDSNGRIRVIILTVLTILLGVLPALVKILREHRRMVNYRDLWAEIKCEGLEMGWLSAKHAPGFKGWGEKQLKVFISGVGLSSSLDGSATGVGRKGSKKWFGADANSRNDNGVRGTDTDRDISPGEEAHLQVDIKSLFTIGETHKLAHLIDERDEILENLEIAEARYISSFKITTPDPSLADVSMMGRDKQSADKLKISRPRALTDKRKRTANPAYGSSSLTSTSFIAPSQYYKLRSPQGVSGGRFTTSSSLHLAGRYDAEEERIRKDSKASHTRMNRRTGEEPTLTTSISSRIIGTRFQEISRNSKYGILPMGSRVGVGETGELGPVDEYGMWEGYDADIPDYTKFGPNFRERSMAERSSAGFAGVGANGRVTGPAAEEWVNVAGKEAAPDVNGPGPQSDWNGGPPSVFSRMSASWRGRGGYSAPRESFPRRKSRGVTGLRNEVEADEDIPPPHERLQPAAPFVRPLTGLDFDHLGSVYADIRTWRSRLKTINLEIAEAQRQSYNDLAEGRGIKGWLLIGRGLQHVPSVELIHGRAKEDVRWDILQRGGVLGEDEEGESHESGGGASWTDSAVMWCVVAIVVLLLLAGLTASIGLALAGAPDVTTYLPFLGPLSGTSSLWAGVATTLAPAVAAVVFITLSIGFIHWAANLKGTPSVSAGQLLTFKLVFAVLCAISTACVVVVGALLFTVPNFNPSEGLQRPESNSRVLAEGAIYMSILAFSIVITVAFIVPGIFLLQPHRLWRVVKTERSAITPRQRFRAMYPRSFDPTYATGASILGITFASTFAVIFPLMAPAVCLLLLLTLVAHRFLVGYVYARNRSQTGGLVEIWLLKRFGTLLAFQPLLLGLVLLSRQFWIEAGVLLGTALLVVIFVEIFTARVERRHSKSFSPSPITKDSLDKFGQAMTTRVGKGKGREESGLDSSQEERTTTQLSGNGRTRGSMASVLEMMSLTLAVMPAPSKSRAPVPLQTEGLDDLTATERAARTHPDTPPHLPPLPFTEHAEEMSSILYAPELIAPPPIIWLPNDSAGVARSEAVDLQKYHDLKVAIDVRTVSRAADEADRLGT
ncbi:hypothetical protein BDV98DRAFT_557831 [Pterulicium gracile]|uniref:CSC1/OSCA1-like 7TM region domain-containing protein n=1 Tax=Pterulicium gracile TaxID=1884261 RepID=A0A5C3R2L8_9AGAR|nr:hypothetical protein BDV98DRAFT_557831 [Pterula gracilis]